MRQSESHHLPKLLGAEGMKPKPPTTHASVRQCLRTALRVNNDQQRALNEVVRLHRQLTRLVDQQLRLALRLHERGWRHGR